jgi:hypothetical protein
VGRSKENKNKKGKERWGIPPHLIPLYHKNPADASQGQPYRLLYKENSRFGAKSCKCFVNNAKKRRFGNQINGLGEGSEKL